MGDMLMEWVVVQVKVNLIYSHSAWFTKAFFAELGLLQKTNQLFKPGVTVLVK